MPRVHPLFPTPEEVQRDPNIYYADNLPVFFSHDMGNVRLSFLSWNIFVSGASINGHNCEERYARIAKLLASLAEKMDLDFILLQEVKMEILWPLLKAEGLKKVFKIIYTVNSDIVTFVRKNRTELKYKNTGISFEEDYVFDHEDRYIDVDVSGNLLKLYNTRNKPYLNPYYYEAFYRGLFEDSDEQDTVIIAGDTNSRFASIDNSKKSLVTGVVRHHYNFHNAIAPDVVDTKCSVGGFVRQGDGQIFQLDAEVIDVTTGEVWRDDRRRWNNIDPVFDRYGMVMCLDPRVVARAQGFENDPHFMEQIESALKEVLVKYFPDYRYRRDDITFRLAAKDNNELGFGICFSYNLPAQYIKAFQKVIEKNNRVYQGNNDYMIKQEVDDHAKNSFFYASIVMLPAIRQYISFDFLLLIDELQIEEKIKETVLDQINALDKSKEHPYLLNSPDHKITCLRNLLARLAARENLTVYGIISLWLDDAENILKEERYKLLKDKLFYRKVIRHHSQPESYQLWQWLYAIVHPYKTLIDSYANLMVKLEEKDVFEEMLLNGYPVLKIKANSKFVRLLDRLHFQADYLDDAGMIIVNFMNKVALIHCLAPLISAVNKISLHHEKLVNSRNVMKRESSTKQHLLDDLVEKLIRDFCPAQGSTVGAIVTDWYQNQNKDYCQEPRLRLYSVKKLSDKTKTAALIQELKENQEQIQLGPSDVFFDMSQLGSLRSHNIDDENESSLSSSS